MIQNNTQPPIIIVGMARAGTTLVSHILGSVADVHIEVEPHILWKAGNFKYLNDEEYDITDAIVKNIRNELTKNLNGKRLVEKSPINALRPHMVHAVFPDARIVYVMRDPVRCIYSNYIRTLKRDSFKMSILIKKYFVQTGSADLPGAISKRTLFQQLKLSDMPSFISFTIRMLLLRKNNLLPFGPKIKGFPDIVKNRGVLNFHTDVYKTALKYKDTYHELYGDNMQVFKLEDIMTDKDQIKKLLDFVQLPYTETWITDMSKTFDSERVHDAMKENKIDKDILALI